MRRVLAYLSWDSERWLARAKASAARDNGPALSEGLSAYANQQSSLRDSMRAQFQKLWCDVPQWISSGTMPSAGMTASGFMDSDNVV